MADLPPYQQDIHNLLSSEWSSKEPDINRTAHTLASSTTHATSPPPGTYIWSTFLAIHAFATSHPQAIDFLLQSFAEATKLLPETVENEYGHGPDAGIQALRWWILEEADCFNTVEPDLDPIGTLDPNDKSNITFTQPDINSSLDAVLSRITHIRTERSRIIISMAIASRCFALNIVREDGGEHIAGLISSNLKRDARWTTADLIASCVLLRGCAGSLFGVMNDKEERLGRWRSGFRGFLLGEGGMEDMGFAVKWHAALVLQNLKAGPFDEDPAQLFAQEQWTL